MKGNLLIIDDEEEITRSLQLLLSSYADNVYTANSGANGLRILAAEEIHCVICDIYMPELSGFEVLKLVRENNNLVPFIFFTAYGIEDLNVDVSNYERTLFLVKPDIDGIIKIIHQMLQLGFEQRRYKIV